MAMLIVQCDTCGNDVRKHHTRVSNNNFCNRDCYLEFHKVKKEVKICEVCGKEFEVDNKNNANRFCSRDCYDINHCIVEKTRTCPVCGCGFNVKASEDKYCSWECYNSDRHMPSGEDHWNWQGGKEDTRDSSKSKQWRLAVYKKDDYKCQNCGAIDNLCAHHIYSYKNYPLLRTEVSNGITYCDRCHKMVHHIFGYQSKEKMLLNKGEK